MDKRATLYLATGLLDELRRGVKPGNPQYARFLHDLRWQDTWVESEHNGWSAIVLADWPRGTKPRHVDALAFSVALAVHELSDHRRRQRDATRGCMHTDAFHADAAKDLEEFAKRFDERLRTLPCDSGLSGSNHSAGTLRRRGVLRRAEQMLLANRTNTRTMNGRQVRLPRVIAVRGDLRRVNAARDQFLPTFAESPKFAALGHRTASSRSVVEAARVVVSEMISEREGERERVRASPPPRRAHGPSRAQPRPRARPGDAFG